MSCETNVEISAHQPTWVVAARIIIQILLPIVLFLTNVRILMTQSYLKIEYRLPGFPDDPVGFTLEERLNWASITLEYLLNDAGIIFLENLRFEGGQPVFNTRELQHLEDVKRLTRAVLAVWMVGLATVVLLLFALWQANRLQCASVSLLGGSQLVLYLMMTLAIALIADFGTIFDGFHHILFEGDSWLFPYNDTLIRLFPERFWRDAFAFVVVATLAEVLVIRHWPLIRCRVGDAIAKFLRRRVDPVIKKFNMTGFN